jgi:conjugal transfer pilus assembly protein TraE
MNHLFKQQSIQELVQYNRWLLAFSGLLTLAVFILSVLLFSKDERWILIPATSPDQRLELSSKGFGETYLKAWASYVMQTLMTTSNDTIDTQIDEIKVISNNSEALTDFLEKHRSFVKGSNIQSVFFPKKITVGQSLTDPSQLTDVVVVSGLFRYWLGTSEQVVSLEKTYRLTYKRGPNDVLLLKNVEENKNEPS